ncbi:MAG: hypothetical protein COA38_19575 [Fluviicola sp.]|nr:MAG: hypothetical protein COA38_19575 [Fluviicola sp.]
MDEVVGMFWFEMIFRFSDHQNVRLSEEVIGRVWWGVRSLKTSSTLDFWIRWMKCLVGFGLV